MWFFMMFRASSKNLGIWLRFDAGLGGDVCVLAVVWEGGPLAGGESPLVTSLGEKLLTFHYSGIFAFALDGIVGW